MISYEAFCDQERAKKRNAKLCVRCKKRDRGQKKPWCEQCGKEIMAIKKKNTLGQERTKAAREARHDPSHYADIEEIKKLIEEIEGLKADKKKMPLADRDAYRAVKDRYTRLGVTRFSHKTKDRLKIMIKIMQEVTTIPEVDTKTCSKCKVPKKLILFDKGNDKDGLSYLCKECDKEKGRKKREKDKEMKLKKGSKIHIDIVDNGIIIVVRGPDRNFSTNSKILAQYIATDIDQLCDVLKKYDC